MFFKKIVTGRLLFRKKSNLKYTILKKNIWNHNWLFSSLTDPITLGITCQDLFVWIKQRRCYVLISECYGAINWLLVVAFLLDGQTWLWHQTSHLTFSQKTQLVHFLYLHQIVKSFRPCCFVAVDKTVNVNSLTRIKLSSRLMHSTHLERRMTYYPWNLSVNAFWVVCPKFVHSALQMLHCGRPNVLNKKTGLRNNFSPYFGNTKI